MARFLGMGILELLVVLLLISAIFGAWGHRNPTVGPIGWSPLGIVLIILLILWLTGGLGVPHHSVRF
jgi:hypothetical protein